MSQGSAYQPRLFSQQEGTSRRPEATTFCWCPGGPYGTDCRVIAEMTKAPTSQSTEGPLPMVDTVCGAGHRHRLPEEWVEEL